MLGFLPDPIRAFALIAISFLGAFALLRFVPLPNFDRKRFAWAWLVLTIAEFFSVYFLAYAVVVAIVCTILRKGARESAAVIYIALLPTMSLDRYTIPGALGINVLFDLDHQRVLTLVLLLPALISAPSHDVSKRPLIRNSIDALFFFYCAWLFMLAWIHRPSLTDSIRVAFEVVTFLLVPYLAVSRLIRTWDQLIAAISALVFSGLLVSFIGIFEQRMTWHFYQNIPVLLHMNPLEQFMGQYEIRFHMLRIWSSVRGGLGLFLVISLSALLCLRQGRAITGWRFWTAATAIAAAITFTVSRGNWIAAGIMLGALILFRLIKSPARFVVVAGLGLFGMPVAQEYFLTTKDAFGTFDYRADLLRSSIPMVWERPIFGWDSMQVLFATGRLEHLRQGQGIIDLVNVYLGEALLRGIPGMMMFSGVLFCSIWAVLRRYHRPGISPETIQSAVPAFLVSSVLATAFLLVTTSLVGHTAAYLWLLVALCSAYAALETASPASSTKPSTPEPTAPSRTRRRPHRPAIAAR